MTPDTTGAPDWLLVRQGSISPEERGVLAAVRRRLAERGESFATVLLGTASYDAEGPAGADGPPGELWLLEDDARGRGVRAGPVGIPVRTVSASELVHGLMSAKRVIQFP